MPGAQRDGNGSRSEPPKRPGAVRGRQTVDALFRGGRRIAGRYLTLFFKNSADGNTRYSVFVPRRLGGSVRRNRMKRVLREHIRTHPHPALITKETIILCKQSLDGESRDKALKEIGQLFDRMAGEKKNCSQR